MLEITHNLPSKVANLKLYVRLIIISNSKGVEIATLLHYYSAF